MTLYLPKVEILCYFIINTCFIIYAIYKVTTYNDVVYKETKYFGFTDGWEILQRKRDNMDYEWRSWKNFILQNTFWYIIHIILTEAVRLFKPLTVPFAHGALTLTFLLLRYNGSVLLLLLFMNISFYCLSTKGSKGIIWLASGIWLLVINMFKMDYFYYTIQKNLDISDSKLYELIIVLAWSLLRCISFTIDHITAKQTINSDESFRELYSFRNFFGYMFYFPTFHLGPIIIYKRYRSLLEIDNKPVEIIPKRYLIFLKDLALAFCWMILTELALHFIYIYNIQYSKNVIEKMDSWALYGFGYLLGQFFHAKYVFVYGIGIAIAKLERIQTPNKPKCIARTHLYSDMWKYFDQGLYEFLFIYLYCNLCKKKSSMLQQLFARSLTFLFIYVWHGYYFFIFVWTVLNFMFLTIENLGRQFSRTTKYRQFMDKYISKYNEYRLNALLGSQLLIPAVLSNFFFLSNYDIGVIFLKRTYMGGLLNYFILSCCLIIIFFTSEFTKRWENRKKVE